MIQEIQARKHEISRLCQQYGVRQLEVFGSAATGTFHAHSDVDLLIEFEPEAVAEGYADRYFGLQESLEKLLGRPVELVVKTSIKNPYFLQSVEETKELLYAA